MQEGTTQTPHDSDKEKSASNSLETHVGPGGLVSIQTRGSIPSSDRSAEASQLAAVPDPPELEWLERQARLFPGYVGWAFYFYPEPDIGSLHVTLHRASDDSKITETCRSGNSGIAWWGWGYHTNSEFEVGEELYAKVAVSRIVRQDSVFTHDWTCATEWSPEAITPPWPAVAGAPELSRQETIGCGYGNASGRPCFQAYRGDPVNTATGSLNEAFIDAEVPAPGPDFRLTRTYSSANNISVWLGPRWALSYPGWLGFSPGWASFKAEDGSYTYFEDEGNGSWSTWSKGAKATLSGTPDTGYTLTTHDQQRLAFDGVGLLTSWYDRSGVGLTFNYTDYTLASVVDAAGRTVTFTYDASGDRLTRIDLADGRWVGYSYTDGWLTSVRDLNGGTTTYTYDSAARLTSITDPNGNLVMQTSFDSSGRVVEQTDATGTTITPNWGSSVSNFPDNNGGIWTDVYDGSVLVEQIDPYGEVTSYRYDYDSDHLTLKPIEVTDPAGNVTTMTYDGRGNLLTRTGPAPLGVTETWAYDGVNNITSYTDGAGNTSSYSYDGSNRLTSETDPLGGVTSYTYTSTGQVATVTTPAGRSTSYSYDGTGNLTSVLTPAGHETTYTYDAAGRMLSVTGPRGNVAGADPAEHTTSYTYDAAGHVTSVTDPLGRSTSYGYDANGNRTSMTDPAGHTTTYAYDAANRLTEVTDPAGNTTVTGYDLVGNVTSVIDPTGATTSYAYDAANRLASTTTPRGNAPGADPADFTTSYGYDVNGNRTTVTDPTGAITTTAFDALNRAVSTTDPLGHVTGYGYDPADNQTSVTDPTGAVTEHTYDANHRLTVSTDALDNITEYGYNPDGQQVSQVSPLGNTTTWAYDADGRVTAVTDPRGNASGADPADFTTSFGYDAAGNRTTITDPLGNSVQMQYDPGGQLIAMVDPASQSTGFAYDLTGNISKVTAPTGGETEYAYDLAGRLTTVTTPLDTTYTYTYDAASRIATATTPTGRVTGYAYTPDGTPSTITLPEGSISYAYDALGRTTTIDYSDTTPDRSYTYDAAGRPTTAGNGTTTAEYDYDDAGRVTGITRAGQAFAYDRDAIGRLTGRTLPDGRTQTYTWDADSRIAGTTIAPAAGSHDITYGYDPAGNLTAVTRQGGPTTGYSYDPAGNLTHLDHTTAGSTLLEQAITWSEAGNPTVVATTRGGSSVTRRYSYDSAGQVTGVCLPTSGNTCGNADPNTSYTYDLNGNRTGTVTTNTGDDSTAGYAYDNDDRPTTQTVDGVVSTLTYDANGTLASQVGPAGTRSFDYGLDANLRTVELEDGRTVGYGYDEAGNRTIRTVDAATDATWTWDTLGLPTRLDERDSTNALTHQWWADPQTELGTALADTATASTTWLLGDHQGSITGLADATVLTGSADLDPYGSPTGTTNGDYADNPLRFHGQYLDDTTGLYDIRARDYDATTGRFTTPDPIATAAGTAFTQTYHYGYNRPTVLTDPTEECAIICTAIIGGVAGAVVGGVDCYLSGDDRDTCLKKIAVGAAAGAITGATLGAAGGAAAGAYGGLATGTGVGATQVAGGIAAGGAGNVLYGSGVAATTGQPYSYGNATNDFLWGAAGSAAGGAAGTVAQRAAGPNVIRCPAPATVVSNRIGNHIVLGKSLGLEQQAQKIGGRHLMNDPAWEDAVLRAVADPKTKISVVLDSVPGTSTYSRVMSAAQRAASGQGQPFDWEMLQLKMGDRLPTVDFYEEGVRLANPF